MRTLDRFVSLSCFLGTLASATKLGQKHRLGKPVGCACECVEGEDGYETGMTKYGVLEYAGDNSAQKDIFRCVLDDMYYDVECDPGSGNVGYCDHSCYHDDDEYDLDNHDIAPMMHQDYDTFFGLDDLFDLDTDPAVEDGSVELFDHDPCLCECHGSNEDMPMFRVVKRDPTDPLVAMEVVCASDGDPIQMQEFQVYSCDESCFKVNL
jgi:hypothetical protein